MINYDALVAHFNILRFLESNGFHLEYIGGRTEYITTCPFCGKEDHLGVHDSNKTFGCYKCRTSGSILKLIQKITNKSFNEIIDLLEQDSDLIRYDPNFIASKIEIKDRCRNIALNPEPIPLPEGYIPLTDRRIPYLDTRGITQDQVNYYKMGVCLTGRYKDRLIVCDVNDNRDVIYWIARDTTGRVPKSDKVLNPPGIGSGGILFNFFLAKNYKVGIITEGVFDSLWVGNNGLCSYGKGIKDLHCSWLIQACFDYVILLYDPDVPEEELIKDASKLSTHVPVRICRLPKEDNKDPDEIPKPILYQYLDKAELFIPSKPKIHEPIEAK